MDSTKPADAFRWLRLARDANVTGSAKAILLALASRANEAGECFPGTRRLMRDAGLTTRTTTRKAVSELVAAGWIRVTVPPRQPGQRQRSKRYRIVPRMGSVSDP